MRGSPCCLGHGALKCASPVPKAACFCQPTDEQEPPFACRLHPAEARRGTQPRRLALEGQHFFIMVMKWYPSGAGLLGCVLCPFPPFLACTQGIYWYLMECSSAIWLKVAPEGEYFAFSASTSLRRRRRDVTRRAGVGCVAARKWHHWCVSWLAWVCRFRYGESTFKDAAA